MLESSPGSTVFAPSNEAFNRTAKLLGGEAKLEELIKSQKDAPKILGLHVIDEQIPSTDIRITKPQNFVTCPTCKTKVNGQFQAFITLRVLAIGGPLVILLSFYSFRCSVERSSIQKVDLIDFGFTFLILLESL